MCEINRFSLANQCTFLSLWQIDSVPIAKAGTLSLPKDGFLTISSKLLKFLKFCFFLVKEQLKVYKKSKKNAFMLKNSKIYKFSSHFLCISLKVLRIFPLWFFLVKETLRSIYNITKNIIFSNEKITFNYVKKENSRISRCFLYISSKLHGILQFRLFFVKERQKFNETKFYCVK